MFCDLFFFFKQKTAYEMRISDWSSDVCSSDLRTAPHGGDPAEDLDARRDRVHHCRRGEIHLEVHARADGEHVVRPHDEADDADRDHGVFYAELAEHRLASEVRCALPDDAQARQDNEDRTSTSLNSRH